MGDKKEAPELARLQISEIRYRRLFEAARDGVLLVDPETRKITDANPFMTTLLGFTHGQLVGKELFEIGFLKDESASQAMFENLLRTGEVRYEDLPLESVNGSRHEVEVVANIYDENGSPVIQCNVRDITIRKEREAHNKLLMAEVNHRARNLLAVVQVIAQQTAKYGDQASFVARLTQRISGLAASQDLLVENEWRGVDMVELVKSQLDHFRDLFSGRVTISGAAMKINASAGQALGMALHELAINAAKYGALSNTTGTVHIAWAVNAATAVFSIAWTEEQGPPVTPPTHKGFGQRVIGGMVESALTGKTEISYAPSGFSWALSAPTERVLEPNVGNNVAER